MEPTREGAVNLAQSATGPLSPHLKTFITSLINQKYTIISLRSKSWHAVAFDNWLLKHGVSLAEVCDTHIDQFHRRSYQPRSDCQAEPRCHEVSELRQLLRYLRAHELCPLVPVAFMPADSVVVSFEQFLLHERGLALGTIHYYCTGARDFLIHCFGSGQVVLAALQPTDIIDFVQDRACQMRPRTLKQLITALRAFLRYAQYRGEIKTSLDDAVPAVASWSTTPPLPRAISPENASHVINSCDLKTPVGLRDRAILLLLARLGLRGGEVIMLQLEDIDWVSGRLCIHGKNNRESLMPIPTDVGEAIATYLQRGRPQSADRHLFLRIKAPIRGMTRGSDAIGSIVSNALIRAGIDTPHKGAHQFRHALAVRMLKNGASLSEIGEILRHRSPIATSIYAKVDVVSLRRLAMPWPGSTT